MSLITTSIQPFQIGKRYRVSCLKSAHQWTDMFATRGGWVPVLLPEHDDALFIGVTWRHVHIDWRFVTDRAMELFSFATVIQSRINDGGLVTNFVEPGVFYPRLKCRREMPANYPHHRAHWSKALHKHYAEKALIEGHCPHKGIDLRGCPAVNGIITCPGHGLRFDAKTGRACPLP